MIKTTQYFFLTYIINLLSYSLYSCKIWLFVWFLLITHNFMSMKLNLSEEKEDCSLIAFGQRVLCKSKEDGSLENWSNLLTVDIFAIDTVLKQTNPPLGLCHRIFNSTTYINFLKVNLSARFHTRYSHFLTDQLSIFRNPQTLEKLYAISR